MTRIRVKGFKIFDDRHGKPRCYHRKTGHPIDLLATPLGSAGFFAECARIEALARAMDAQEPRPGTLGQLIEFHRSGDRWRDLAPRTRADYQRCLDYLAPIADTPIIRISTPLVAGIIDKAATKLGWRRANMVRTVLSEVFKTAVPRGLIERNFTDGVPQRRRPKDAPRINRPWTDDERAAVMGAAPPHLRVALALMANTGMDPSDAFRLRP